MKKLTLLLILSIGLTVTSLIKKYRKPLNCE